MRSRAEIEERLRKLNSEAHTQRYRKQEREAFETAQQLAEWLDSCHAATWGSREDCAGCSAVIPGGCRAYDWLKGSQ